MTDVQYELKYSQDTTIEAIERTGKNLTLAVLLVVFALLFVIVRFLYSIVNYVPLRSIITMLVISAGLLIVAIYVIRNTSQRATNALNKYNHELNVLLASFEQDEMRMSTILDTANDGIVTVTENGIVESFNLAAARMFGYEHSEVIGKNVKMLMPAPFCCMYDEYIKNYLEGEWKRVVGRTVGVSARRKSGEVFPILLSISQVTFGDRVLYTGIVHDITEIKKAERVKDEFISIVSHEIRTPLTAIMGSLGIIASGMAGTFSGEAEKIIDIAHKNCSRLLTLINNLLDIKKLESGGTWATMKPLVLAPLLSQVVEGIGPYAEQLGVRLKIENRYPAAKVNADSERIMQVLTNLLSNAVKFSPRDDDVHILVSRNGSDIRIAVTDHGPGIPEDFRDRIFQQFAQADSSDRRGKGGTGLGLSISKKIIEKHGGEIGFHTEPGIDTTFYFELPELHEEEVLEPHFLGCQIVSSVDDLTGVLNRSCFEEQLNGEWRRALRNKTPLSMILVEIAHFDVYHTNYGKQSADQCLRLIAVALRKLMMRPGDVFARYGEMQFAALLPETGAKGAACIAEKMRSQVDELGIDFAHPEGSGKVTVIVGISTMIPGRESNPEMLLTAAGSALS